MRSGRERVNLKCNGKGCCFKACLLSGRADCPPTIIVPVMSNCNTDAAINGVKAVYLPGTITTRSVTKTRFCRVDNGHVSNRMTASLILARIATLRTNIPCVCCTATSGVVTTCDNSTITATKDEGNLVNSLRNRTISRNVCIVDNNGIGHYKANYSVPTGHTCVSLRRISRCARIVTTGRHVLSLSNTANMTNIRITSTLISICAINNIRIHGRMPTTGTMRKLRGNLCVIGNGAMIMGWGSRMV